MNVKADIKFTIRTLQTDALIFAAFGSKDFLTIGLENSEVCVHAHAGGTTVTPFCTMQIDKSLTEHDIIVMKSSHQIILVVDGMYVPGSPLMLADATMDLHRSVTFGRARSACNASASIPPPGQLLGLSLYILVQRGTSSGKCELIVRRLTK